MEACLSLHTRCRSIRDYGLKKQWCREINAEGILSADQAAVSSSLVSQLITYFRGNKTKEGKVKDPGKIREIGQALGYKGDEDWLPEGLDRDPVLSGLFLLSEAAGALRTKLFLAESTNHFEYGLIYETARNIHNTLAWYINDLNN